MAREPASEEPAPGSAHCTAVAIAAILAARASDASWKLPGPSSAPKRARPPTP